jgi:hypothetical protein
MAFPHIIRHGLTLWLGITWMTLYVVALILRSVTKSNKGIALYVLLIGWVCFIWYFVRIYS